jgi:hypothetical protein
MKKKFLLKVLCHTFSTSTFGDVLCAMFFLLTFFLCVHLSLNRKEQAISKRCQKIAGTIFTLFDLRAFHFFTQRRVEKVNNNMETKGNEKF